MDNQYIYDELLEELNHYGEYRTAAGYPRYVVSSGGFIHPKCNPGGRSKKPDAIVNWIDHYYLYCAKRKRKDLVSIKDLLAATFPPSNPAKTYAYNSDHKIVLI